MSSPVFTYSEDIHIGSAAQAMIDNQIHAIVVVRDNQLAGLLTSTDLLKYMADRDGYSKLYARADLLLRETFVKRFEVVAAAEEDQAVVGAHAGVAGDGAL